MLASRSPTRRPLVSTRLRPVSVAGRRALSWIEDKRMDAWWTQKLDRSGQKPRLSVVAYYRHSAELQ